MDNAWDRFEKQIGSQNIDLLNGTHVAVLGLGGVGGSVVETLARCGIGEMTVVDDDVFDITNINRQILCTQQDIGKYKVDVCEQRLLNINPDMKLHKYCEKYPSDKIFFTGVDYIVDAIDDVNAKIEIIRFATANNIPIITCLGTGNKFNPLDLRIANISQTHTCPLAKIVRKKLTMSQIYDTKCLFSVEKPLKNCKSIVSSNAFVPNTAGILLAREVIFDLIDKTQILQ